MPESARVFQVDASPDLAPYTYERQRLSEASIDFLDGSCNSVDELLERGAESDVLWLAWRPAITREVLQQLPACRLVVRWGVGYDQIDVAAATELGVAVANAPTYATEDVAEHTIALVLAARRRLAWIDSQMHNGAWPTLKPTSFRRLNGQTLGLLGVGRIGRRVAARARGLGLQVVGHDPFQTADVIRSFGIEPVGRDALFGRADILSVHVPLSDATFHLVNGERLAELKRGSILVNTSRGPVVDQAALIAALESGQLGGAALDVYETEPLPVDSPLRQFDSVVLTPHMAAYSAEAWADLRSEMCSTTISFVREGWAPAIVNPAVRNTLRSVEVH
jgi:phosphoglycerate dehydrogenase-like enzyme